MKYPKLNFWRQSRFCGRSNNCRLNFSSSKYIARWKNDFKGPSSQWHCFKVDNAHSCHKMTDFIMDFEKPRKPSTSVCQKMFWVVTTESLLLKSNRSQWEAEQEMGLQKHLAFNGPVAAVKQCAEIILIRLGQAGCIIRRGSPPFSPCCSEHNHSLKHHLK